MKRFLFALAGLACLCLTRIAFARVEADPNKEYAITPEVGPWVVSATCYAGPDASMLAHELVLEIRSRFDLPAWVFNRGDEERRQSIENWRKMQEPLPPEQRLPYRGPKYQQQCAVLIGGYKDIDAARRMLDKVRKLDPPSSNRLKPVLTVLEPVEGSQGMAQLKEKFVNPFERSFVARNPTVPVERHPDAKNDPFLKELNAGESYSLLKCRKPWTLVIATFQGVSIIEPETKKGSFLTKLMPGKAPETLSASALNAHNFAEALRTPYPKGLGLDAFVLHMRAGSLVTVGGFDRKDDQQMLTIQQVLESHFRYGQKVALLAQPFAIEVPRPK
jgi:hypothetical protein